MPKFLLLTVLCLASIYQPAQASVHFCGPNSLETQTISGNSAQQLYNSLKEQYPNAWGECGSDQIAVITVGTTSCIYDAGNEPYQYACTAWLDKTGQGCEVPYTCPYPRGGVGN